MRKSETHLHQNVAENNVQTCRTFSGCVYKRCSRVRLRSLNAVSISEPATAAQSVKNEMKSWDKIATRKQHHLMKAAIDYLQRALHKLFERISMFDAGVEPSSLDDVLSMVTVLQFGTELSQDRSDSLRRSRRRVAEELDRRQRRTAHGAPIIGVCALRPSLARSGRPAQVQRADPHQLSLRVPVVTRSVLYTLSHVCLPLRAA